jgi:hypothetical protein
LKTLPLYGQCLEHLIEIFQTSVKSKGITSILMDREARNTVALDPE